LLQKIYLWRKEKFLDEAERLGVSAVCSKYNVSSSTFYDWKKNQEKISTYSQKFGSTKRACNRLVQERDEAVITWLPGALKKGVPAAGPVLKQKAVEVNKQYGDPTKFSGSNGWLHKFKKRQQIRTLKVTGMLKLFFVLKVTISVQNCFKKHGKLTFVSSKHENYIFLFLY